MRILILLIGCLWFISTGDLILKVIHLDDLSKAIGYFVESPHLSKHLIGLVLVVLKALRVLGLQGSCSLVRLIASLLILKQ